MRRMPDGDRIFAFDMESELLGLIGPGAYRAELNPSRRMPDWHPPKQPDDVHEANSRGFVCRCRRGHKWSAGQVQIECVCGRTHARKLKDREE